VKRAAAVLLVAAMLAGTALALLAPLPVLAALVAAGIALMRGRRGFLLFLAISLPINVAILAYVDRDGGWLRGLEGGLRLGAALAVNLAILTRVGAARIVDGLRLPPRTTALLAAVLLAAHDIGRDFARLKDARRLEGAWPLGRLARAREAARLVPALVVAAHRRAGIRREALQLAGLRFPAWFVPLVAVAALAAAGRMAFLALPNVALTYVVAFLGGVLFGALVGAGGAALGMLLTDLALTGLYPGGLVNVPAMALLGLLGGALRRVELDPATSAAIGIVATFLFSAAADSVTWLVLYADVPEAWAPMVMLGLAFNVIPALVNGALFAASVAPTVRAFRAWRGPARAQGRAPGVPPESPAAPPAG
jgi:hypothetical protein